MHMPGGYAVIHAFLSHHRVYALYHLPRSYPLDYPASTTLLLGAAGCFLVQLHALGPCTYVTMTACLLMQGMHGIPVMLLSMLVCTPRALREDVLVNKAWHIFFQEINWL